MNKEINLDSPCPPFSRRAQQRLQHPGHQLSMSHKWRLLQHPPSLGVPFHIPVSFPTWPDLLLEIYGALSEKGEFLFLNYYLQGQMPAQYLALLEAFMELAQRRNLNFALSLQQREVENFLRDQNHVPAFGPKPLDGDWLAIIQDKLQGAEVESLARGQEETAGEEVVVCSCFKVAGSALKLVALDFEAEEGRAIVAASAEARASEIGGAWESFLAFVAARTKAGSKCGLCISSQKGGKRKDFLERIFWRTQWQKSPTLSLAERLQSVNLWLKNLAWVQPPQQVSLVDIQQRDYVVAFSEQGNPPGLCHVQSTQVQRDLLEKLQRELQEIFQDQKIKVWVAHLDQDLDLDLEVDQ